MVIDKTVKSNRVEDCVFYLEPEYEVPAFKVGDEGTLAFDQIYYKDTMVIIYLSFFISILPFFRGKWRI